MLRPTYPQADGGQRQLRVQHPTLKYVTNRPQAAAGDYRASETINYRRAMVAPATYGFIGLTEWGFIDSDVVTDNTRR
jgi:hypothetical protein